MSKLKKAETIKKFTWNVKAKWGKKFKKEIDSAYYRTVKFKYQIRNYWYLKCNHSKILKCWKKEPSIKVLNISIMDIHKLVIFSIRIFGPPCMAKLAKTWRKNSRKTFIHFHACLCSELLVSLLVARETRNQL